MMPYLLWKQGYFKALLDIYNLIERSQSTLKSLRINNAEHILKIINFCLENKNDFMSYGDELEFYFYSSEEQKGKKKVKTYKIVSADSYEVKKIQKEYSNPYSFASVSTKRKILKSIYSDSCWFEHFYNEYKNKPLEPKAKEFFDKVCKENGVESENFK